MDTVTPTSGPSDAFIGFVTGEKNADLSVGTTGPATAMDGEEIEFDTVVRNNGPAAIAGFRVNIPHTAGTHPALRKGFARERGSYWYFTLITAHR